MGGVLMLKAKRIRYVPIAAGAPEIGRSIQCQPSRTESAKSYIVQTKMIMPTDRTKENWGIVAGIVFSVNSSAVNAAIEYAADA
jgi:hypothetical protein